jgi:hypothetical protein
MSFAQKDRLDRIQHILLPTTEKKFHRKRMKNDEIRAFFEPQGLIEQPNIFAKVYIIYVFKVKPHLIEHVL